MEFGKQSMRFLAGCSVVLVVCGLSYGSPATWFDAAWKYRRPIDVNWKPEEAGGEELALAQFYSAGHALPDGRDLRVATEDGRIVASHLLWAGPGDRFSMVFALQKP